eukprot:g64509.t1
MSGGRKEVAPPGKKLFGELTTKKTKNPSLETIDTEKFKKIFYVRERRVYAAKMKAARKHNYKLFKKNISEQVDGQVVNFELDEGAGFIGFKGTPSFDPLKLGPKSRQEGHLRALQGLAPDDSSDIADDSYQERERPKQPEEVAIIGAGLSGLAAARFGIETGQFKPVLFEQSKRVGGLVQSDYAWRDGQFSEKGGEYINSNHLHMLRLVTELNLQFIDLVKERALVNKAKRQEKQEGKNLTVFDVLQDERDFLQNRAFNNSQYVPYSRLVLDSRDIWQPVHRLLFDSAERLNYTSLPNTTGQLVDSLQMCKVIATLSTYIVRPLSPLPDILTAAYTQRFGEDCVSQSGWQLVQAFSMGEGGDFYPLGDFDQRFRVKGGLSKLLAELERLVGTGNIKFNHTLVGMFPQVLPQKSSNSSSNSSLPQNSSSSVGTITNMTLLFRLANGTTVQRVFKKVILAVPFPDLRRVDTRLAPFGAVKRDAIQNLTWGTATKLQLQFSRPFWIECGTDSIYTDTFHFYDVTLGQGGNTGIVDLYFGGSEALAFKDIAADCNPCNLSKPLPPVVVEQLAKLDAMFPDLQDLPPRCQFEPEVKKALLFGVTADGGRAYSSLEEAMQWCCEHECAGVTTMFELAYTRRDPGIVKSRFSFQSAYLKKPGPAAQRAANSTRDLLVRAVINHAPAAYPNYKPGQVTRFGGVEGEQEKNVYFAGTQCSYEFGGTMNGAVYCGERAAKQVIKDIGSPLLNASKRSA